MQVKQSELLERREGQASWELPDLIATQIEFQQVHTRVNAEQLPASNRSARQNKNLQFQRFHNPLRE